MSYCNNEIKALNILNNMDKNIIETTLSNCEKTCNRYYQCDTVALMEDRIKELDGELLRCPHCDEVQEPCNCPDLFYEDINNSKGLNEQYKLLLELNECGFNIVTCGHCGQVFIHKI